ncbi:MAG: hypothetical protein A2138_27625 [Deltaproteobacteria bacterium RBG_16_71_12]|nr:MAG: hypothetical protein A2138_27625 [Deltaproteobacteria bacterium RBG_16_71_12]
MRTAVRFALATAIAWCMLALACACASAPKERPRAPPPDPGELLFLDLEQRLLRAKAVHLKGKLVATGAITADLTAELWLKEGNRARLDVAGVFEGKRHQTRFVCDGERMQVGTAPVVAAEPELRDALVYGATRMGLLHNAALLVGGEAPDHGAGGAHSWVKAERARSLVPATRIAFDIVVATKPTGDAILQLDDQGRALERVADVRFDVGAMHVVERYTLFEVDGDIEDAVFALAATPPAP